nr:polyphosphate polymerase domain-containing protein [Eubacterium sp.]
QEHMEADKYGEYTITNIYYDTDNYELIRHSIEKPLYKEKFRVRSYGVPGDNDLTFAEIKKKFKGVVYKRRVADTYLKIDEFLKGEISLEKDAQIQNEIRWFFQQYKPKPKVFIGYDRKAFAGKDGEDIRLTFDQNVRWRTDELDLRVGDYGKPVIPEERIVMEIKVPGAAPLWLVEALSSNKIYSGSFSKYGTAYKSFVLNKIFKKGNL